MPAGEFDQSGIIASLPGGFDVAVRKVDWNDVVVFAVEEPLRDMEREQLHRISGGRRVQEIHGPVAQLKLLSAA
jgi:hypothetical protein